MIFSSRTREIIYFNSNYVTDYIFKLYYIFAVSFIKCIFQNFKIVKSITLLGNKDSISTIPLFSDLDFIIVVDASFELVEKFRKKAKLIFQLLKYIFPFLGKFNHDFHIWDSYDLSEFRNVCSRNIRYISDFQGYGTLLFGKLNTKIEYPIANYENIWCVKHRLQKSLDTFFKGILDSNLSDSMRGYYLLSAFDDLHRAKFQLLNQKSIARQKFIISQISLDDYLDQSPKFIEDLKSNYNFLMESLEVIGDIIQNPVFFNNFDREQIWNISSEDCFKCNYSDIEGNIHNIKNHIPNIANLDKNIITQREILIKTDKSFLIYSPLNNNPYTNNIFSLQSYLYSLFLSSELNQEVLLSKSYTLDLIYLRCFRYLRMQKTNIVKEYLTATEYQKVMLNQINFIAFWRVNIKLICNEKNIFSNNMSKEVNLENLTKETKFLFDTVEKLRIHDNYNSF